MAFADEITVEALEADPYPIYARLRREAPVAWVPAANVWFVTRWQDVEFVSKNGKLVAAEVPTSPIDRTMGSPTILTCDGPAHGELRRGFDVKYKPRAVAEYIDDLAQPIIAQHLDRIASKGSAELMSEYFEPASSMATARSRGFARGSRDAAAVVSRPFDRRRELRERSEEAGDRRRGRGGNRCRDPAGLRAAGAQAGRFRALAHAP
jgi:cytochrome P450